MGHPFDRRSILRLLAGTAAAPLAACAHAPPARAPGAPIRAVAFDLFTLFDPRAIDAAVVAEVGSAGAELAAAWKRRSFEDCWLRAAADRYQPFDVVIADALAHVARAREVTLTPGAHRRLLSAWTALPAWPDTPAVLDRLRAAGLALAPLANFAPAMIEALLAHARLRPQFTHVLSTHAARAYKPAARAYRLGVDAFGLRAEQIAFSAFGDWDAAGAAWFGYPTFWVNRLGVPVEREVPRARGPDLVALASWLSARADARARP